MAATHGTDDHGTTDVSYHEKTFEGFLKACAIVIVVAVAILLFLAVVGT